MTSPRNASSTWEGDRFYYWSWDAARAWQTDRLFDYLDGRVA